MRALSLEGVPTASRQQTIDGPADDEKSRGAVGPRRAWAARVALASIFTIGLALRLLNVGTAVLHEDELHYVGDAAWTLVHPSPVGTVDFLRSHPKPHPRIDPRTGAFGLWPAGHPYNQGHPALYGEFVGMLFLALQPSWPGGAVRVGRAVNATVDAMTILLLPQLIGALGAGAATGLLGAALYALYPPAITYGSIGNIDPPLAPLIVLVLWWLLSGRGDWWHAARLGIATAMASPSWRRASAPGFR